MKRRRSRGAKRSTILRYAVLFVAVLLVGYGVAPVSPTGAFTTADVSRHPSIDVVRDIDAALELDKTADVQEGTTQCIVVVTNRLAREETFAVSLADRSTDLGHLEVSLIDSLKKGDTVKFTLSAGSSQTVKLAANSGTNGSTAYYHVNTTATDLGVQATDRTAPIVNSSTAGC